VTVRPLGPDEAGPVLGLWQALGDEAQAADASAFLSRPETVALVAEEDGRTVGLVYGHELAHPDGVRTLLLYSLDVVEAARRRGHGRALVESFVAEGRRRGCSEVWVLTETDNGAALATYAAAGATREADQAMLSWQLDAVRPGPADHR
jgi:ribosomal protein S18 acetylase RimI-like enzyme